MLNKRKKPGKKKKNLTLLAFTYVCIFLFITRFCTFIQGEKCLCIISSKCNNFV